MKKLVMLIVVAALATVASAAVDPGLTTIFSDDFSGDLSGWNLDYINTGGHNPHINVSGQLDVDAVSADPSVDGKED